jgi:hypothetical protein
MFSVETEDGHTHVVCAIDGRGVYLDEFEGKVTLRIMEYAGGPIRTVGEFPSFDDARDYLFKTKRCSSEQA